MSANANRKDYSLNFLQHHLPSADDRLLYAREASMMAVAAALVEALEVAGKNRAWLADALGRTPGFVSQVLSGSRNMTLKTLADIAFALGLEVSGVTLAPLGESLMPKDLMDRWLDEESVVAEGKADVIGSGDYQATGTVVTVAGEPAFVG